MEKAGWRCGLGRMGPVGVFEFGDFSRMWTDGGDGSFGRTFIIPVERRM